MIDDASNPEERALGPGRTGGDAGTGPREHPEEEDLVAAVPGRSHGREVWVGLLAIAGVLAVLITLFALTDPATFRGRYILTSTVSDASGVRAGDPVQMRGVNIGRVQGFEMVPGGVELRLELENDYAVPADSRLSLRSSGLLGGSVAAISPGDSERMLQDGQSLPGSSQRSITGTASELSGRADTVLGRVEGVLSDETVAGVRASVTGTRHLLAELNALASEQRAELSGLTASLRSTAAELENATDEGEVERLVTRMDSVSARLLVTAGSLDRAGRSLETVLGRIERGEGTLGRLSTDASLYRNLNGAAVDLRELTEDIRRQPERYIRLEIF